MPTKQPSTPTLARPKLNKGERYIGAILNAEGRGHHIILLPGDATLAWKKAVAWAKKKGGDLPNRIEQAMLFADHAAEFAKDWYWSNTPYTGNADFAWFQSFGNGGQDDGRKSFGFRCRAVRRVAI